MKPREFDELIKQKFEEGGFEYKAQNWDRLADELDGKGKKRSLLVWWMPLIGVAASVALAMGVPLVLREGGGSTVHKHAEAQYACINHFVPAAGALQPTTLPVEEQSMAAIDAPTTNNIAQAQELTQEDNYAHNIAAADEEQEINVVFEKSTRKSLMSMATNAAPQNFIAHTDLLKKNKKADVHPIGFYTFDEITTPKKPSVIAISLMGGMNYCNRNNGYMLGATASRMINDRVYIEGDIAFVGTNNTTKYNEVVYTQGTAQDIYATNSKMAPTGNSSTGGSSTITSALAAKGDLTAKNTSDLLNVPDPTPESHIRTVEKAYNLYYAQITPSIGYKLMKRMSVGIGPDFQQMLGDNRPAISPTETGNIRQAPLFDIGFMGKTEFAISSNIKAAVYYREGINNIITPMNKFIDRNYIQLQIKCAILNR